MPRDQVFISYNHKDQKWREDLDTHLKPYLRDGSITSWSDEQIDPGSEWFKEIQSALANSKVAVLLVSPDFIASDFIHHHELGPLLKKAEQGGLKVLWVPVRHSAYKQTALKNYQAVLNPAEPLANMTPAEGDRAWVKICDEIKKAIDSLKEPSQGNLASPPTSQSAQSNILKSDQNKKPTSHLQKKMPWTAIILALVICLAGGVAIYFSLHHEMGLAYSAIVSRPTLPVKTPTPSPTINPTSSSPTTETSTPRPISSPQRDTPTPAPDHSVNSQLLLPKPNPTSAPANAPPAPTTLAMAQLSDISYALTTMTDPVQPGKAAQFMITTTNLTNKSTYSALTFHVPRFTSYGRYSDGTACGLTPAWLEAGTSISTSLDLALLGSNQALSNGTIITLLVTDQHRGASFSNSVTVNDSPVATLDLFSPQGTIAPGETFDYFLAFHNASGDALAGAQLSMPVPPGAGFVSADGGGVLGSDQVVRWRLGVLAVGATGQAHLFLKASTAKGARPALRMQAALSDSDNRLLAQASDFKPVYVAPTFSYVLTTSTDPVQPGKTAQFTIKITNLTDKSAYSTLAFHVPRFTSYGRYSEGTACGLTPRWIDAGASILFDVDLKVNGGNQSPPDGTIITLALTDPSRGASFSHSVGVNRKIAQLNPTSSLAPPSTD